LDLLERDSDRNLPTSGSVDLDALLGEYHDA
jgi:hypothetical protein